MLKDVTPICPIVHSYFSSDILFFKSRYDFNYWNEWCLYETFNTSSIRVIIYVDRSCLEPGLQCLRTVHHWMDGCHGCAVCRNMTTSQPDVDTKYYRRRKKDLKSLIFTLWHFDE